MKGVGVDCVGKSAHELNLIVPQAFGRRDSDKTSHLEKLLSICQRNPYRKPTQVVEEKILRCSSESRPRNSAKLPCNFGRRGAPLRRGRREEAQATVYQKHMALRNRKMKYKA